MSEELPLRELLQPIRDTIREELNHGLSPLIQEIQAVRQGTASRLGSELNDVTGQQEISLLDAKNKSLEDEVRRLKETLEQTKQVAKQRILEAESKAKENAAKLHKIIIESGLGDSGPTDDDVEKACSHLAHIIFQFVMKHCTDHASSRKPYSFLPPEAKNAYVAHVIANWIYDDLFEPDRKIYGLVPGDDEHLERIENALLKTGNVPHAEMAEWRVRTCQLSKFVDPQGHFIVQQSEEMASRLYSKLAPYWHYSPQELKRKSIETKNALVDIYRHAFRVAMMFRTAKVEYRWLQRDRENFRPLKPEEVDLFASAGYKTFEEAKGDFRTVFGEVVKGSGPSGIISEESRLLRKCSVLLGPVNPRD